jgi:hypothetical protein
MALTVLRARHGLCAAVAGLLCCASVASADRLPPDKPLLAPPAQRSAPLPLTVEADADTPVHRIVIPKAVLAKLAGDLPDAGTIGSAFPSRSIVAAFALSAAVACGLVVLRRGRADRLAAVLLCGLSLAGAGALLAGIPALADIPAPDGLPRRPRPRPFAGRPESVTLAQGGTVILEIGEEGNEAVVLVVGKPAAKPE